MAPCGVIGSSLPNQAITPSGVSWDRSINFSAADWRRDGRGQSASSRRAASAWSHVNTSGVASASAQSAIFRASGSLVSSSSLRTRAPSPALAADSACWADWVSSGTGAMAAANGESPDSPWAVARPAQASAMVRARGVPRNPKPTLSPLPVHPALELKSGRPIARLPIHCARPYCPPLHRDRNSWRLDHGFLHLMTTIPFRGVITALVTPFSGGHLDEKAFETLIERQIAAGVHGVVPVGTTGETSTLSHEEHKRVVTLCVEVVAGRIPVIAGAGSNATAEAVDFVRHAKAAGAAAALVVTPYYNRPSQAGLFQHYATINET